MKMMIIMNSELLDCQKSAKKITRVVITNVAYHRDVCEEIAINTITRRRVNCEKNFTPATSWGRVRRDALSNCSTVMTNGT